MAFQNERNKKKKEKKNATLVTHLSCTKTKPKSRYVAKANRVTGLQGESKRQNK